MLPAGQPTFGRSCWRYRLGNPRLAARPPDHAYYELITNEYFHHLRLLGSSSEKSNQPRYLRSLVQLYKTDSTMIVYTSTDGRSDTIPAAKYLAELVATYKDRFTLRLSVVSPPAADTVRAILTIRGRSLEGFGKKEYGLVFRFEGGSAGHPKITYQSVYELPTIDADYFLDNREGLHVM